eukprot:TRINITY_DN102444_c0_g1_i1.p1 TRINITY_DN102444_c0_g1~~TRINITY_DN102444_c0_g1_i1.p1  ORF type:complete len:833 (-),score=174.60 TRINITY_DN102444_c0_g1_i1:191-2611(-)
MHANSSTSSLRSGRVDPWHDVLEVCKKGFANKMGNIGTEILHDLRSEIQQQTLSLRHDMEAMLELQEKRSDSKLEKILSSLQDIAEMARSVAQEDPLKTDLTPFIDEVKMNETVQAEMMANFQRRIEEAFSSLNQQFSHLLVRAELEEEKVQSIGKTVLVMDGRLKNVLQIQDSLLTNSAMITESLEKAKDRVSQDNAELLGRVSEIVGEQLEGAPVSDQMQSVGKLLASEFNSVLNEIGKLQQAFHIEFAPRDMNESTSFSSFRRPSVSNSDAWGRASNPSRSRKRVREYWSQTEEVETASTWAQTEKDAHPFSTGRRLASTRRRGSRRSNMEQALETQRATVVEPSRLIKKDTVAAFNSSEALRHRAKLALISNPPYNVFDLYHTTGRIQKIARSPMFDNVTLLFVLANAVWMGIAVELNPADFLTDSDPVFVVGELVFATYFFFEILIRYFAFAHKIDCLKDFWFVFDSILVTIVVIETWIMPFCILVFNLKANLIDLSILRIIRLVKLLRLSRLHKVLRSVPELTIIMKGIGFASRSVSVFCLLWLIVIYVFAIFLKQLTEPFQVGKTHFSTVLMSANTLLLSAIMPDQMSLINSMREDEWYLFPIMVAFVLLCSVILMYMLVGILVQVVGVITTSEKEAGTVSYLADCVRQKILEKELDLETLLLSQPEFEKLILDPDVSKVIGDIGVDFVVLLDMLDVIYEDAEKDGKKGLTFADICDIILTMRGANQATVKDVKEQIRIMKSLIKGARQEIMNRMDAEFATVNANLRTLMEEAVKRDDDEDDGTIPRADSMASVDLDSD